MIKRLDYDDEKKTAEQARKELDNMVGVKRWRVSTDVGVPEVEIDPNAPLWWDGEEEASDSFLTAMGVNLE